LKSAVNHPIMNSHYKAPGSYPHLIDAPTQPPLQGAVSLKKVEGPDDSSVSSSEAPQSCCAELSNNAVNSITTKRTNNINWDDYFMAIAFLSAMRSKDPSTQVGACIVSPDKRIVGIGYNGFPSGCSDDELPWARVAENALDTKYPVCHRLQVFWYVLVCFISFLI
jgi:hypothetical protein